MPIQVQNRDILSIPVDAVINAANQDMTMGRRGCGGVSGVIHGDFDSETLAREMVSAAVFKHQREGDKFPISRITKNDTPRLLIPVGSAVCTSTKSANSGSRLKANNVSHIIHAVGPDCRVPKQYKERKALLTRALTNALKEAYLSGARSIALPVLSSGVFKGKGKKAFTDVEIATIYANVLHKYQGRFDNITVCAYDISNPKQEYPVLAEIRKQLVKTAGKLPTKKTPAHKKITPFQGEWLSDEQVSLLITNSGREHPDIDLRDSTAIFPVYNPSIPKNPNPKKVIVLSHGITEHNVGGVVNESFRNVTVNGLDPSEFTFVVAVNVGTRKPKREDYGNVEGNHWVLAVIEPNPNEPDAHRMVFADSNNDSANGSNVGTLIHRSIADAGLNIGDRFLDLSVDQQEEDGWSCGYFVAKNAIDILTGKNQLDRHVNKEDLVNRAQEVFQIEDGDARLPLPSSSKPVPSVVPQDSKVAAPAPRAAEEAPAPRVKAVVPAPRVEAAAPAPRVEAAAPAPRVEAAAPAPRVEAAAPAPRVEAAAPAPRAEAVPTKVTSKASVPSQPLTRAKSNAVTSPAVANLPILEASVVIPSVIITSIVAFLGVLAGGWIFALIFGGAALAGCLAQHQASTYLTNSSTKQPVNNSKQLEH